MKPTPGLEPGTPSLRERGLPSCLGLIRPDKRGSWKDEYPQEDAPGRARLDAKLDADRGLRPRLQGRGPVISLVPAPLSSSMKRASPTPRGGKPHSSSLRVRTQLARRPVFRLANTTWAMWQASTTLEHRLRANGKPLTVYPAWARRERVRWRRWAASQSQGAVAGLTRMRSVELLHSLIPAPKSVGDQGAVEACRIRGGLRASAGRSSKVGAGLVLEQAPSPFSFATTPQELVHGEPPH